MLTVQGLGKELEYKVRKTGGGDAPFTTQFYQGALCLLGKGFPSAAWGEGQHILWVTTLLCPINTLAPQSELWQSMPGFVTGTFGGEG